MKKFYLLIGLLICGGLLTAQTNTFPSTGNVGIGTTSPTEKLDVSGNINWSGFNTGNARALKIGYSGGNYGGIGYNIGYTNTTGIFDRPINDQSSYLEFHFGGFRFFGTSNAASASGVNINGGGTNLNLLATMTSSGNFGIGTSSPGEKLEINGRIKAGDRIYANSSDANALSLVQSYNSAGGASVLRSYSGTSYWDFAASQISGGNALFIGQGIDVSVNNAAIAILSNNNVGIGTNSPNAKLAVNGNIRAKEVKVETANWPDYVFGEEYELPSLQSTEQHIKEKGHLPGIPSAAEVKANGVDLGEMNAKLLQKIEELTLHLIEKDKQLMCEKATNSNQELRLKNLEEKIDRLIDNTKTKQK